MTNHCGFERLRNRLGQFLRARDGNLAVIFAFAAIPVITAVGTAVDLSKVSEVKTQLQNALDAAVLAGVTQPTANQLSTANAVFNGDFIGKYGNTGSASFIQNADKSLSGTASSSVSLSFLALMWQSSMTISAAATAKPGAQATTPVCMLLTSTLDAPSLLVNSGANLNAPNCEMHVLSTQSPAATFNATLNAKRICIRGSSIIRNGGVTPPVVTGCTTISDPFAGTLPAVSASSCTNIPGANNINKNPGDAAWTSTAGATYGSMNFGNNSVTLNPGTFCQSVNFNGVTNGTVTLNPGVYEIHGIWNVNSGWTVSGSGVTFYFVDQNSGIHFNNTTSATLSAPTTGTNANILMYEPVGLTSSYATIDSSTLNLTGLIYLPSRKLTVNSTSNLTSTGLNMVLSTLTLNTSNWTIAPGASSMSVASGTAASAYLSK